MPKTFQAISSTEAEINPAGHFSLREGTQAGRRGSVSYAALKRFACDSSCQIWLCRLGHDQGQLACGLRGPESSPSPLTNHVPSPPSTGAKLCLLHTEGTVSAASASLTASGGAFSSWDTDRQCGTKWWPVASMRVLCCP